MKFKLPQDPNKQLLDDPRFEWVQKLWRHIRGDAKYQDMILQNGWVAYGAPIATPQFMLKGGVVYVKGVIKDGVTTASTLVFTLPEGYRPGAITIIPVMSNYLLGRVDVEANGAVRIQSASAVWLTLDFSFVAEQ